eukprot:gene11449-23944_t
MVTRTTSNKEPVDRNRRRCIGGKQDEEDDHWKHIGKSVNVVGSEPKEVAINQAGRGLALRTRTKLMQPHEVEDSSVDEGAEIQANKVQKHRRVYLIIKDSSIRTTAYLGILEKDSDNDQELGRADEEN